MIDIEVRYLDIFWSDSNTVLKLEKSIDCLEINKINLENFVETTIFPKLNHYIGFKSTNKILKHIPYIELANGKKQELISVKVPGSSEVWWIQADKWDVENRKYLSEIYRTSGRVSLNFDNQILHIDNNSFNFNIEELEYYLSDFKSSLWMLILNEQSIATVSIYKNGKSIISEETINIINSFIEGVEKLIHKPSIILSEYQDKSPRRLIRPVSKTFREFSIRSDSKHYTSRLYSESYNTLDNQYINYCVSRISYILKTLQREVLRQKEISLQKIEFERKWQNELNENNKKKIDKNVVENEIIHIKEQIINLEQELINSIGNSFDKNNLDGQFGSYTLSIGDKYGPSNRDYFVNLIDGKNIKVETGCYLVVKFPFDLPADKIKNLKILVEGKYKKYSENNSSGNAFYRLDFICVFDIKIVESKFIDVLNDLLINKDIYKSKQWTEDWDTVELADRAMERKVSEKKVRLFTSLFENMDNYTSKLNNLSNRLFQVSKFFIKNKINKCANCPSTMVFVQNPHYALAKKSFISISNLKGLDDGTLNNLMIIDQLGLVNVSNLYEKWCLLQIIKVLHEFYYFDIESGWQNKLIKAVLNRDYNIEIKFSSHIRHQYILLTFEKVLDSGKRPDFVLDLYTCEYTKEGDSWVKLPRSWHCNRLVLDAKFRGNISEKKINELVTQMYSGKNYSENGVNKVFVIHPTPMVIDERTSPLSWGGFCNYGQFKGGSHQFGHIFVAPSMKHPRSIENLQRLIGLFLQEHAVILNQSNYNCWHSLNCISCGSFAENLKVTYSPTKIGNSRWIIQCTNCELTSVKTICYQCQKNIFKNGIKWTYHRTRVKQISNVVCPSCESFL